MHTIFSPPKFRALTLAPARSGVQFLLCALAGCSANTDPNDPRDLAGVRAAESSLARNSPAVSDRQPAAIIGDEPVSWEDLRASLGEAAGGAVVEEFVLDRMVRREMSDRNLATTAADVAHEHELFEDQSRRSAGTGTDQSPKLLAQLQRARGLGPARFKAMLERNAGLRKLVRDEVVVEGVAVARELEARFGPRVRCRIIVTGTEKEAARARARLVEDAPERSAAELSERFAAHARATSLDPSASRGGLLDPISPVDPSYAAAVLYAVKNLKPGAVSPIVVLDHGFAILLGEGEVQAESPPASARSSIEAELRLRLERLAMDRLAQRLMNSARVTVFDRSLGWSWQNRVAPGDPR